MIDPTNTDLPARRPLPDHNRLSNPLFFPMILIGGVMGLLAGYGVLSLMADKGVGPLKQQAPPAAPQLQPIAIDIPGFNLDPEPRAVPKASRSTASPPRLPMPETRKKLEDPAPVVDEDPFSKPKQPVPPPAVAPAAPASPAIPANPVPVNDDPPLQLDKPSALLTLTLEKPVLRAIAESDSKERVLCDVGFSNNLLHRGDTAPGFSIVAANLAHGAKRTVELGANITGGGAAIEITVLRRSNTTVCELRPLFSLPSSEIQPLTITGGTRQHNELTRSLNAARSARDALPELRSTLSQLQNELRDAQQAARGTSGAAGEALARQSLAIVRTTSLPPKIALANRKIAAAEKLSSQEPTLDNDFRCLNQISDYAKSIASVSTISVRFHIGEKTMPATVK